MTDRKELGALIEKLKYKGYQLAVNFDSNGYIESIKVNDYKPLNPLSFAEKYRPIAKLNRDFREKLQLIRTYETILDNESYILTNRAIDDIKTALNNIKSNF